MTHNKTITDILIDRSIPSHIREEHPLFIEFLSAFYDWMEIEKNPHNIANCLRDYRSVDTTLDEFVQYFERELLASVPPDVIADKRLLAKHIKDLYLNKGNEASYKLLFQMLFGESIEFCYPKEDILRASDGKWYEQKAIKVTFDPDVLQYSAGYRIAGQQSGASALVESAVSFVEREQNVIELILSDIRGDFIADEIIEFDYVDGDGNEKSSSDSTIYNIASALEITSPGSDYEIESSFTLKDADGDIVGSGAIKNTTKGTISNITLIDGGIGYRGLQREVDRFYSLPLNHNFNGDILLDVAMDGSTPGSNGTDYLAFTIDEPITNIQIDDIPDRIEITDSDFAFGTGAFGIVTLVDNDGTILDIELVESGDDYSTPQADVDSDTGTGAIIEVSGGGGAIQTAILNNFPIILPDDYDSTGLLLYPDFTTTGDGLGTGILLEGSLEEYAGIYINDDGHLSSTKRLQDNFYYQDYSYVLKVGRVIDEWKDIVNDLIHPAGLALFGEVSIFYDLTSESSIIGADTNINTTILLSSPSSVELFDIDVVNDQTKEAITDQGITVTHNGETVVLCVDEEQQFVTDNGITVTDNGIDVTVGIGLSTPQDVQNLGIDVTEGGQQVTVII